MPYANVRGARINYETLGSSGPWVALSPGGRRDMSQVRYLGELLAKEGFRVLLHDRRNCGSSDVVLEGEGAEYDIWADDLVELMGQLGATPAFVGGSSSGCRLAMVTYTRHPDAVSGLLLWRVTGGPFACERLAWNYYGQFVEAAKDGGMQAVCETEHFRDVIANNPANRDVLMAMDPQRFIDSFTRWGKYFLDSADLPVIGYTEEQLRAFHVPTSVVPGNDMTHPKAVGERAASLIPGAELTILLTQDRSDMDIAPQGELEAVAEQHAKLYVNFMHRHAAVGTPVS